MQSDAISSDTKAYVRQRCADLSVDAGKLAAASHDTPLDAINDAAYATVDSWRLRSEFANIEGLAPLKSDARKAAEESGTQGTEPDWDALLAQAQTEGEAACTNNDYGVYDEFWEKNHTFDPELFENFDDAEDEYADLSCFLEICREVGASYADFSGFEYEKYFLCDTVHPGWKGWVRIEHAFYDFVSDRRGQDDCVTWGSDAE